MQTQVDPKVSNEPQVRSSLTGATDDTSRALAWRQVLSRLPLGNSLGDEDFHSRHRLAQIVGWGLFTMLLLLSVSTSDPIHMFVEVAPMGGVLIVAHRARRRTVAVLASSAALMFACALLVHATDGLIESHFLFFVLLPLIALYQDLRAFALALGFVVFHHAVIGVVAPEAVYNHPAAIESPVRFGALHGAYILGLVIVLIVEWSFSDRAHRLARSRTNELEIMQVELVHAQKMESVGQLAAGIAHEINTPMQYIGDNTHFLDNTVDRLLKIADAADRATAPHATPQDVSDLRELLAKSRLPMLAERAPKAAADALSGVENVSRIVTAMKRFSHPGDTEMASVDVNESITTTLTVCRNEWKYVADVVTDFGELPTVHGHLGELNQVWLNLVVNAAHAIEEEERTTKGVITIATAHLADEGAIRVSVSDDGAGISPEHVDRVLDPFFTTKEVGKGTGQGLTIARRVITQDHNGTLGIESTKHVGTTFTVTLPVRQTSEPIG